MAGRHLRNILLMYPCQILHYFYKVIYRSLLFHTATVVDLRKERN